MKIKKTIQVTSTIILATLLLLITTATAVSASPYSGYNTIGSYHQYQYGYQGGYQWEHKPAMSANIQLPNTHHHYNYQQPPRAGGWFGGGTGWLTGLRAPVHTCVEPVHYSSFSRPNCGGGASGGYQGGQYGGYHGGHHGYQQPSTTRVRETSVRFGFYG